MAVRFTECFQTLRWIELLALGGGYYLAIRELRSMLEGVIQAYYIDCKYPALDVIGKLAVLNELIDVGQRQSHGRGLINIATPPEKNEISDLYGKLCQYVHPTVAQMEAILGSPESDREIIRLMSPNYNQELFEQCCELSGQVVSHILNINRDFVQKSIA